MIAITIIVIYAIYIIYTLAEDNGRNREQKREELEKYGITFFDDDHNEFP